MQHSWVILCNRSRKKGQFRGFVHQLIAQFQGIPLEKSQPAERTFAGRMTPSKRTFGRVKPPSKPTFALILQHLRLHPTPAHKNAGSAAASRADYSAPGCT
jgi:hypothetical protein